MHMPSGALADSSPAAAAPGGRQHPLSAQGQVQLQVGARGAAAPAPPHAKAADWRLAAALAGAPPFAALALALSRLTALCYAHAGRARTSALIYADVAAMLLQAGDAPHACRCARAAAPWP